MGLCCSLHGRYKKGEGEEEKSPRDTLYNGLYRKAPFFMLQVCERVGISLGM